MTDAPERIWAFEDYPGSGAVPRGGMWCDEQSECPEGTPTYIRADLIEALEAENQKLRAALRECEDALDLHGKMYPAMVKGYTLDALNAARTALREPETECNHNIQQMQLRGAWSKLTEPKENSND